MCGVWWCVWGTSSAQLIANLQIKHSPHPAPMFCTHYVHSICIHVSTSTIYIHSAFVCNAREKICLIMLKPLTRRPRTRKEICKKKLSTFQYWGPMLWALQKDCFRQMKIGLRQHSAVIDSKFDQCGEFEFSFGRANSGIHLHYNSTIGITLHRSVGRSINK